jgi:RNA recognition motif-containing protein
MLKDESNKHRNNIVNVNKTPSNNNNVNEIQQQTKDRTLFCINIDQKCTEDILYELFLQVLL